MTSRLIYTCDWCMKERERADWIELWFDPSTYTVKGRSDPKYPHGHIHACSILCAKSILDNVVQEADPSYKTVNIEKA